MNFKWINLGLALVLSVGTMAAIGCTAQTDAADSESEQGLGTVSLPLVTPTQATYKLHNATFAIKDQNSALAATLDSDSDPDAQALTASLYQGTYSVRLQDGWELDSVADDGTETPVTAALVSSNPQTFTIKTDEDTNLSFTFTTESGSITIGNGTANVSAGVASMTLKSCDVTGYFYNSCPSGQTCLLADATGGTFCATAGSLKVGDACSSEQCVAGAQCMKSDPDNPDQGVCTEFCNTNSYVSNWGCNCVSLGFPNSNIGICGPKPDGVCDLLDQTSCPSGQACQYVSGGFAVCGTPGTTPANSSCSSETCAAGYDCYYGYCRKICDTRNGSYNNPDCSGNSYYNWCSGAGTGYAGRCD